jgi:hypothetical protein
MRLTFFLALLLTGVAAPGSAQQRAQRPDSLEAEVRRLRLRIDSLQLVLERLVGDRRDTAQVQDELAALRAAARAAAGATPDTAAPQGSRTRDLQMLNPEISATGDVVGSYARTAGTGTATAVPREFEFSFQSALDPYTRTKIFATYEQELDIAGYPEEDGEDEHGGFEIEEGYLYWVGLPGAVGLKAGKFRQDIGLYNRWHTHALWEVDRPLPAVAFLGHDGLIQTGVSVTAPSLRIGPSTQTAVFEATAGTNDALFAGGSELSYLGRVQSFWDVGGVSYLQLGATGVWGENTNESLTSRLVALDFAFRWAPPGRALYRDVSIKGEWYFGNREVGGVSETGHGGYGQLNVRLDRRWIVGARVDYLDPYGDEPALWQIVPTISWWQSEWVRVRLQYNHVRPDIGDTGHTVLLQVVWAMGPHKHETY